MPKSDLYCLAIELVLVSNDNDDDPLVSMTLRAGISINCIRYWPRLGHVYDHVMRPLYPHLVRTFSWFEMTLAAGRTQVHHFLLDRFKTLIWPIIIVPIKFLAPLKTSNGLDIQSLDQTPWAYICSPIWRTYVVPISGTHLLSNFWSLIWSLNLYCGSHIWEWDTSSIAIAR